MVSWWEVQKNTVTLIKKNKYWNSSNLSAKDPVVSNLCSQSDIEGANEKAERIILRKKKEKERELKKKKLKIIRKFILA